MGHGNSDRLYVTQDEMSGIYGDHTAGGGRRIKASDVGFERLPFDCCALSLQPWSIPVCSVSEGTIFELTNIIPFLKKHGVNPATGAKMESKDLIRLNFFKNSKGKFHDPVSFKEFNEHSHIIAVRPSGNVFTNDTIQQLNVKAKFMNDLVDDTPFTKKDLITLQDPHNVEARDLNNLHHLQASLKWSKEDQDGEEVNAHATGSASKILHQMRKDSKKEDTKNSPTQAKESASQQETQNNLDKKRKLPYNTTNMTTGMMAASFTSSGLDVRTTNERQLINEEEYMFEQVASGKGISKPGGKGRKNKAHVRVETNFGPLDIELHVDKAPKTCYNFLELCKADKYANTTFHRLIPGFMIQGGDPTGTGRGGQSIWGKPFRDEFDNAGAYRHTHRGTISMANRGPATNGSQWFIAFRKLPHLDAKHTVFGQILQDDDSKAGSLATLDKFESVPTEPKTDRPLRSIRILGVYILDNPFDEYKSNLESRLARENMSEEERKAKEAKRRKREEDRTTWLGTNLAPKDGHTESSILGLKGKASGVGKYLVEQAPSSGAGKGSSEDDGFSNKKSKAATSSGGFGDFSSW